MVRHARPVLLLMTLLSASIPTRTQQQVATDDIGLSGYVIAPDGSPVTEGTVLISSRTLYGSPVASRVTATIDRAGRFRLVPTAAGFHELMVIAPGLATHRVHITVPLSRTMKLPAMRLSLPTFFRARFVTAEGEPIMSPQLRRHSLDVHGDSAPVEGRTADHTDGDGTITTGPLPRGVTTMAFDIPLFAQMRLPDLYVTGAEPLLDGGTITVSPGATLHVDLVDANGMPVTAHDVTLEDAVPLSPGFSKVARTNHRGRASFERLSKGRYRVSTFALGRCAGSFPLVLARVVAVSGTGALRTRMIIRGTANFRVASVFGPLRGVAITVAPDAPAATTPQWMRPRSDFILRPVSPFSRQSSCAGATDGDGRVTLTNFPPGPARVSVRQLNSTFVRRVSVPDDGREVPIAIPDGFLPLRVVSVLKNAPISNADVTWIGNGGRVEARTNAVGEALLEGVSTLGGTLSITASGFEPGEEKFAEPPGMLHEVALTPSPPTVVELRVVNSAGAPVRNAVVELTPANAIESGHIAATDANGVVTFADVPPGSLRFVVTTDDYQPATIQVAEDKRTTVVVRLSRPPSQ